MKKKLTALAFFTYSAAALGNDGMIIEVPGSPLTITSYEVAYQEDSRYAREGVRHRVTVENDGDQDVSAYGIGFFAFDAFNRNMGRPLTGIDMDTVSVGGSSSGGWVQSVSAAFTFQGYGTGVAYVRKARLADGTVWEGDMEYVLQQLQDIESGLSLEDILED